MSLKNYYSDIEKQIFIGGCRRSGTTMLGAILGAHSECICTPESTRFILDGLRFLEESKNSPNLKQVLNNIKNNWRFKIWELNLETTQVPWEKIGNSYPRLLEWLASQYGEKIGKPSARIWIDHTPGNMNYALTMDKLFPQAKLIHIVRDGRAVASSIMPLDWGPNTIIRAAEWWVQGTAYGLALETLLNKEQIIRVKYEDLVLTPEKTIKNLCDFLNLEFQTEMIAGSGFVPPRYTQKQHSLVGKAPEVERVSQWKNNLSPRQIEIFERITHEFLSYLGYPLLYGLKANHPTGCEKMIDNQKEIITRGINKFKKNLRKYNSI